MLGVLEFYCNPENAASTKTSQVVMGLDLPHRVLERNMDLPAWMYQSTFANLYQITGNSQASLSDAPSKDPKSSGADNLRARAEQAESELYLVKRRVEPLCREGFALAKN